MTINRNNNTPASSPRSVARDLRQEFALEATQTPRYNLRSQNRVQELALTQPVIPLTLSEEFANITRNARQQARTELGVFVHDNRDNLSSNSNSSSSTHQSDEQRVIPLTLSEQFANITRNARQQARTELGVFVHDNSDNLSVNSNASSSSSINSNPASSSSSNASNTSSDATVYPIEESPVTRFNTSPALLEASVGILEHLAEQQGNIGLNEDHYLGLSNDFGNMHTNATMTAGNITQRLNALFENPNEAQQAFLRQCQEILNPSRTATPKGTPPNSPTSLS